ncbi:hypothetical protein EJB05_23479, partial [Eragrostis curvula]
MTKWHCSRQVLPPATPSSLTAHSGHCDRRPSRTTGLTSSSSPPLFPSVQSSSSLSLSPFSRAAIAVVASLLPRRRASHSRVSLPAAKRVNRREIDHGRSLSKFNVDVDFFLFETSPESTSSPPPFTGPPLPSDEVPSPASLHVHTCYGEHLHHSVKLVRALTFPLAASSRRNA